MQTTNVLPLLGGLGDVCAGDYAFATADAYPHDEWGGDQGGTVLLSMTAPDGILFEYFDESMENRWTVSIEEYVENWNNGTIHGEAPQRSHDGEGLSRNNARSAGQPHRRTPHRRSKECAYFMIVAGSPIRL